ncbi:unnamed protein product [[Actinomadura] parvosata subsp. kistnae]|nr:unnamed protein product [Actinomadura parvosata subsp. kistnae]
MTAAPHDAAALYFYKQVDSYVELAYWVSDDLFRRPHLYTRFTEAQRPGEDPKPAVKAAKDKADTDYWQARESDIVALLAALRSRTGSDEFALSHEQRLQVLSPIFGEPGETNDFDRLRDDLIAASTAYAERVFDTGVEMLRERVRTAHRPLQNYLTGLTGASSAWSAHRAFPRLTENITFRILRHASIASVFGVLSAPSQDWPYAADANGDKLIEQISLHRDKETGALGRQAASNLQRLAARGAEALAAVIDYTENSEDPADDVASLDVLITSCYTWGAARNALSG